MRESERKEEGGGRSGHPATQENTQTSFDTFPETHQDGNQEMPQWAERPIRLRERDFATAATPPGNSEEQVPLLVQLPQPGMAMLHCVGLSPLKKEERFGLTKAKPNPSWFCKPPKRGFHTCPSLCFLNASGRSTFLFLVASLWVGRRQQELEEKDNECDSGSESSKQNEDVLFFPHRARRENCQGSSLGCSAPVF